MAFAIMRAKKLATMGSVASSMQHNFRERETPNADPERTPENEHLQAQTTDEATQPIVANFLALIIANAMPIPR